MCETVTDESAALILPLEDMIMNNPIDSSGVTVVAIAGAIAGGISRVLIQ